MKILFLSDTTGGPFFSRMGIARCLGSIGHEITFYDPSKKSHFDMFDEFKPDIFLGTTYGLDRALQKCLIENPQCKIALQTSSWGPLIDTINRDEYPILFARDDEIKTVEEFHKTRGIDCIFLHYHQNWMEACCGHWQKVGLEAKSLANAADVFAYFGGELKPEYVCDCSIVSGYWSYKAKTIDKWILPLCNEDIKIKIYGNGSWPVAQYVGTVSEEAQKDIFASSINLNCHEPHSQVYGFDVNERFFKAGLNGPILSDCVKSAAEDFFPNNEIIFADSPQDFKEKLFYYMKYPEKLVGIKKRLFTNIIKFNTYYHRSIDLMLYLKLPNEATKLFDIYTNWKRAKGMEEIY